MAESEGVLDFLTRRVRELTNQLAATESAVNAIRKELEQAQRALTAARGAETGIAGGLINNPLMNSREMLNILGVGNGIAGRNALAAYLTPPSSSPNPLMPPDTSLIEQASIKQLVMTAFGASPDFMQNGATVREIRDFIRDVYGRDIERSSLSPQLSRLANPEGLLDLREGRWYLVPKKKGIV